MRLRGKVAIVTGAAKGIGAAIAEACVREGARVAVLDLDEGGVESVASTLTGRGADVLALRADVTRSADIDRALAAVVARWDRIDILVNNAGGFAVIRATEEIAEEEWHAILASNLTSVFLCSKAVLPIMKRQRYGRIVNLASVVGRAGAVRVTSHYAAAKAGVIGFTRHLALEVGADGITVNAVAPGTTATDACSGPARQRRRSGWPKPFPCAGWASRRRSPRRLSSSPLIRPRSSTEPPLTSTAAR